MNDLSLTASENDGVRKTLSRVGIVRGQSEFDATRFPGAERDGFGIVQTSVRLYSKVA